MDAFNNREIAVAIWAVFLAAVAATKPTLRAAFADLAKAFGHWLILVPLALTGCYIALVVYGLTKVGLWDASQVKNTLLWGFSVAAALLFRVMRSVRDPQFRFSAFCKEVIADNLQLIVLLEFIVGFYTFTLPVELVIVPVASLVLVTKMYASTKEKYAAVARLMDILLVAFGGTLLLHAAWQLIANFSSFATRGTLNEFTLPPLLSLLFMPFLFLAGLLANYENVFVRLRFAIPDSSLRSYARWRAIVGFHLRTRLLNRWSRNVMLSKPGDRSAVDRSIREVKVLSARERAPAEIPLDQGWSPYLARRFLESVGFQLGDYHRAIGDTDEWFANSPYLQVGEGILPNNIAYYVEGNELVATTLKIVMNVNEPQEAQEARRRFIEAAKLLHTKALRSEMLSEMEECLAVEANINAQIDGKNVSVAKVIWPGHLLGGYEMRFIVQNMV